MGNLDHPIALIDTPGFSPQAYQRNCKSLRCLDVELNNYLVNYLAWGNVAIFTTDDSEDAIALKPLLGLENQMKMNLLLIVTFEVPINSVFTDIENSVVCKFSRKIEAINMTLDVPVIFIPRQCPPYDTNCILYVQLAEQNILNVTISMQRKPVVFDANNYYYYLNNHLSKHLTVMLRFMQDYLKKHMVITQSTLVRI